MQADESVLRENFKKIYQKPQRKYTIFIQLKSERKTIRGNRNLIRIKKTQRKITFLKKKRIPDHLTMSDI